MDYCSNERMRIDKEVKNHARLVLRGKARVNEMTIATVKAMPFPLNSREWVARQIWKSEQGKVFIAFESTDDKVDYGMSLRKVRGLVRGIYCIEQIADRRGANQSRVTIVQRIDAGGVIPTWVMDKKIPDALSVVQEAINEFRQDERIDSADQKELSNFIRGHWMEEQYSEEENALLARVCQKFEVSLKGANWKKVRTCEERSDESRRHANKMLTCVSGNSTKNVGIGIMLPTQHRRCAANSTTHF